MVEVGQQNIRGIDIDKLAKGFADEMNIFKQFLTVTPTSAREIRWYQKTAGFLTGNTTSGITSSPIANVGQLTLPSVIQPNWTRNTSYVRKYIAESPWISEEDLRDSDPDVLATMVRDITRGVENQVDIRIYDQLSGQFALSGSAAGTGWDDTSDGNPILDLLSGSALVRGENYDIDNMVALMHPNEYKALMNFLISTKGSSIPNFSSEKVRTGELMRILNYRVVVSDNATETVVVGLIPQRAATWKSFMPITATTIEDPGIGRKIRVWEEGEIIVTDINAGHTIKGC